MTYSEKRNALPPAVPAFGLCGLLLAGTSYLNIALQRNIERRAGAVPCLADYFVSQKSNFYFLFLILPLFLCSLTFLMRHDFLTVFILRSGSRKRLWLKQAGLTVQYGGATSLLYTAVTGAAGSLFSQQYINWQSPESFYFLTGHGTLSLPLWEVAACFFLSCFFAYAAAGLLLILVWWVKGKPCRLGLVGSDTSLRVGQHDARLPCLSRPGFPLLFAVAVWDGSKKYRYSAASAAGPVFCRAEIC